MATIKKASRLVASSERHAAITDVEAGDTIDVVSVLGRPAKRVKIVPDDSTDSIQLRLNNRVRIPAHYNGSDRAPVPGWEKPDSTYVVSEGSHHPLYTLTGEDSYMTEEGLYVSFIQVEAITFGAGGSTIEIYCW